MHYTHSQRGVQRHALLTGAGFAACLMNMRCAICGSGSKLSYSSYCRECYNAKMRVYMLDRYNRRRAEFIATRGDACATCGSHTDLEVDHIVPAEKSFSVGKAFAGWSDARLHAELIKCQVLCGTCHSVKTRIDLAEIRGIRVHWEHGTLGGYNHCRCEACRSAKSDYSRKHRPSLTQAA